MHKSFDFSAGAVLALAAGLAILPAARIQSGVGGSTAPPCHPNLLRNAGFEDWSYGLDTSIPPATWTVLGDPAKTFNGQQDLLITRVPGETDTTRGVAGGNWAVELNAVQSGSYLSQFLVSPLEWRGKTLTLVTKWKTTHVVTSPTITIDDGVTSTSQTRQLVIDQWQTIGLRHVVHPDATQVEIRLNPGAIARVDDVQLLCGDVPGAPYVPRDTAEPALLHVPLGTVLDWFRVHPSVPVPEGYAIADGSVVTDLESPFVGLTLPNLGQRVVRGETDVNQIGLTGGANSHSHSVPSTALTWLILQDPLGPTLRALRGETAHGTTSASSWPPYTKLLKIVRIR